MWRSVLFKQKHVFKDLSKVLLTIVELNRRRWGTDTTDTHKQSRGTAWCMQCKDDNCNIDYILISWCTVPSYNLYCDSLFGCRYLNPNLLVILIYRFVTLQLGINTILFIFIPKKQYITWVRRKLHSRDNYYICNCVCVRARSLAPWVKV